MRINSVSINAIPNFSFKNANTKIIESGLEYNSKRSKIVDDYNHNVNLQTHMMISGLLFAAGYSVAKKSLSVPVTLLAIIIPNLILAPRFIKNYMQAKELNAAYKEEILKAKFRTDRFIYNLLTMQQSDLSDLAIKNKKDSITEEIVLNIDQATSNFFEA